MRLILLIAGTALLTVLWFAPIPESLRQTFSFHMTLHMGVVAVAAPLLSFGLAGSRLDPVRRAPRLFAPIPASVVELIAVWAWHAPALHHAARNSAWGFALEQGTFLATGLLMWLSAFGGDRPRPRERTGAGVLGLLLTSMHMTLLGALLALTPRPLFHLSAHGHHASGHALLAPLADQHLGGAIMLFVGGVSYLAGGLWLTADLIRGSTLVTEKPS